MRSPTLTPSWGDIMDLVDVTIRADEGMIPCVLTMAESVSRGQGMDEGLLLRMRLNLEEILIGLISYGSSYGYDPKIDIIIRRDGDELVYSVRDKGVPFDYSTLENGGYSDVARILSRTDGAELRNLGREGREQMCNLSEAIEEEALQKGLEKGRLEERKNTERERRRAEEESRRAEQESRRAEKAEAELARLKLEMNSLKRSISL